jgi:hypothetical protein
LGLDEKNDLGKRMKSHVRHTNVSRIEVPRHGGVDAKAWRRRVANAAVKQPVSVMRTLSFPLDLDLQYEDFFQDADLLYNTVEGLDKGSLAYLLMRAHLCGLAIHTSTSAAHVARIGAHFPDIAFLKALEDGLGLVNVPLTPQGLFVLFSTPPSGERELTPQDLANRIHSSCFGQKISDKTDDNIRELLTTVAEAACSVTSSYKHLQAHPWEALSACGTALQKQSPLFPSLAIPPIADNLGISLAYSGLVDPVIEGEPEQFWPHHIIACLLRHHEPKKINDALLSYQDNGLSQLFGALLSSAKNAPGLLQTTNAAPQRPFCHT